MPRRSAFIRYLMFVLGGWATQFTHSKASIRTRVLKRRELIPAGERAARSAEVCAVVLDRLMEVDPASGYIGLYSAQGSELVLDSLVLQLAAIGYRVAFPARVTDSGMEFFTTLGVSNEALLSSLVVGEPFTAVSGADIANLTKVSPSELAALVVPAIAFDTNGYRVGFGGGYYDRYLKRVPKKVPRYGVCFEEQILKVIPIEPHDLPMDEVIVAQSAIISQSFHGRHTKD
jgi:5-formyltetrahydrofolate cyclo-ligase